jgi:hypothetical protein
MNTHATEQFREALSKFLASSDMSYTFPAGGAHDIPTTDELALLDRLNDDALTEAEKTALISAECTNWNFGYSVVIFGIRTAILAVRTESPVLFRAAVLACISGIRSVDWRDALRALSVFENCGNRLSIAFREQANEVARQTSDERKVSTVDDYFSRSEDMRSIDVLGIAVAMQNGQLMFVTD